MNVVVLADQSPANAWLIRAIEQAVTLRAIIRPDRTAPRSTPTTTRAPASSAPISPTQRVLRRVRRLYFDRIDRAAERRLSHLLFPDGALPTPNAEIICVPAWDINGITTQDALRALAPDLLVVSGAPILKPAIHSIARYGTVNLHFGISPNYRGMHTINTPWHAQDYAHVGATLHYIDDGIDTGPVLFRVYPAITGDDDVVSVEAKITQCAANALCEFLSFIAAAPLGHRSPGRQFIETGRLVRFNDRSIRTDVASRVGHISGTRAPVTEARVELFYRE
jgi:methionyl-tRNA formyltransferase